MSGNKYRFRLTPSMLSVYLKNGCNRFLVSAGLAAPQIESGVKATSGIYENKAYNYNVVTDDVKANNINNKSMVQFYGEIWESTIREYLKPSSDGRKNRLITMDEATDGKLFYDITLANHGKESKSVPKSITEEVFIKKLISICKGDLKLAELYNDIFIYQAAFCLDQPELFGGNEFDHIDAGWGTAVPDFVRVYKDEDGKLFLRIIDAKLARKPRAEHKLQVAIYAYLLDIFVNDLKKEGRLPDNISVDTRIGGLWNCRRDKSVEDSITYFELADSLYFVKDFLDNKLLNFLKNLDGVLNEFVDHNENYDENNKLIISKVLYKIDSYPNKKGCGQCKLVNYCLYSGYKGEQYKLYEKKVDKDRFNHIVDFDHEQGGIAEKSANILKGISRYTQEYLYDNDLKCFGDWLIPDEGKRLPYQVKKRHYFLDEELKAVYYEGKYYKGLLDGLYTRLVYEKYKIYDDEKEYYASGIKGILVETERLCEKYKEYKNNGSSTEYINEEERHYHNIIHYIMDAYVDYIKNLKYESGYPMFLMRGSINMPLRASVTVYISINRDPYFDRLSGYSFTVKTNADKVFEETCIVKSNNVMLLSESIEDLRRKDGTEKSFSEYLEAKGRRNYNVEYNRGKLKLEDIDACCKKCEIKLVEDFYDIIHKVDDYNAKLVNDNNSTEKSLRLQVYTMSKMELKTFHDTLKDITENAGKYSEEIIKKANTLILWLQGSWIVQGDSDSVPSSTTVAPVVIVSDEIENLYNVPQILNADLNTYIRWMCPEAMKVKYLLAKNREHNEGEIGRFPEYYNVLNYISSLDILTIVSDELLYICKMSELATNQDIKELGRYLKAAFNIFGHKKEDFSNCFRVEPIAHYTKSDIIKNKLIRRENYQSLSNKRKVVLLERIVNQIHRDVDEGKIVGVNRFVPIFKIPKASSISDPVVARLLYLSESENLQKYYQIRGKRINGIGVDVSEGRILDISIPNNDVVQGISDSKQHVSIKIDKATGERYIHVSRALVKNSDKWDGLPWQRAVALHYGSINGTFSEGEGKYKKETLKQLFGYRDIDGFITPSKNASDKSGNSFVDSFDVNNIIFERNKDDKLSVSFDIVKSIDDCVTVFDKTIDELKAYLLNEVFCGGKFFLYEKYYDPNLSRIERGLENLVKKEEADPDAPRKILLRPFDLCQSISEDEKTKFELKESYTKEDLEREDQHPLLRFAGRYENGVKNTFSSSQLRVFNNLTENTLTVLTGPPGSGKTDFIARSIVSLCRYYKYSCDNGKNMAVLISANSHTAIENALSAVKRIVDMEIGIDGQTYKNDIDIVKVDISSEFGRQISKGYKADEGIGVSISNSRFRHIQFEDYNLEQGTKEIKRPGVISYLRELRNENNNSLKPVVFGATNWACSEAFGTDAYFDIIVLDEASQVRTMDAMLSLQLGNIRYDAEEIRVDTRYLIVGDDDQLAPIMQTKLETESDVPDTYRSVLGFYSSSFDLGMKEQKENKKFRYMLTDNFRMNEVLLGYSAREIYNRDGMVYKTPDDDTRLDSKAMSEIKHGRLTLSDAWKDGVSEAIKNIIDPDFPLVVCFMNDSSSENEAGLVSELTDVFYKYRGGENAERDVKAYFGGNDSKLAVVAPTHKHIRKIKGEIKKKLSAYSNTVTENTVYVDTVEKLQGQERDIIICSYGIGDINQILEQMEFIYDRNRLNVSMTRARKKLVLLLSNDLTRLPIEALDVENEDVMKGIRFLTGLEKYLKDLVENGCGDLQSDDEISARIYRLRDAD